MLGHVSVCFFLVQVFILFLFSRLLPEYTILKQVISFPYGASTLVDSVLSERFSEKFFLVVFMYDYLAKQCRTLE